MSVIVQKFGGTSVATPRRIQQQAERIAAKVREGNQVVAVVSAMGASTDDLLSLGRALNPEGSPREVDLLLSTGEVVSCALLAMALQALGIPGRAFTGPHAGIFTDGVYGSASITELRLDRLRAALAAGEVPVVAGFQGLSVDGELTTLGRGGSDTTAVALAVGLEADGCEIYTDVDGVFTADPRTVASARKLDRIHPAEMLEIARCGAQVMHPPAVELGAQRGLPILVTSSLRDSTGTWITADEAPGEAYAVTAIAHTNMTVSAIGQGLREAPNLLTRAAAALNAAGIGIEKISAGPISVTLQVRAGGAIRAANVLHAAYGLHRGSQAFECTSEAALSRASRPIQPEILLREEAAAWG